MVAARNYSSTAAQVTLSGAITNAATSMVVSATTGFPLPPFAGVIDKDRVTEEAVLVTAVVGTTLTITRGYDSTAAVAHDAGATFDHAYLAIDAREAGNHVGASAAVHGITGSVVGTTDAQTLTNKILTSPTINSGALSTPTITGGSISSATFSGGTLSGTIAGTPTFSGAVTFSVSPTFSAGIALGSSTVSGTPTFSGAVTFSAAPTFSAGAALGTGQTYSGTPTFSGVVTFNVQPVFSGGVSISSGGALSGTFSGSPTFSGNPVFSGTPSFSGTPTFSGITSGAGGPFGTWTNYTPTLSTSGGATPTLGTGGTASGRWNRIGKLVNCSVNITFGTSPTAPGGDFFVSLPAQVSASGLITFGVAYFTVGGSANLLVGLCICGPGDSVVGFRVPSTTVTGDWNTLGTGISPVPFASGETLRFTITYESV